MRRLANKAAIITGSSRGIGKAISNYFSEEGAKVVILSRSAKEVEVCVDEIKDNGCFALGFTCDVSDFCDVQRVVNEALDNFSKIDILVNNAGVQEPIGLFKDVDIFSWFRNIQVNLFGTVMFCKAVLPHMIQRRRGKIINLSGGGSTSPRPHFSAYGVAKTAILRFTETLAEEVKEYNIFVNAIAPGAVNTKMLEEILEAGDRAGEKELEDAKRRAVIGGTPIDRVCELALFLASEKSDGITGKLISAPWDPWEEEVFCKLLKEDKDLATLRRIDNKYFCKK